MSCGSDCDSEENNHNWYDDLREGASISFLLVVKAGMLLGPTLTVPPDVLCVLVVLAHHRAAAIVHTANGDHALILGLI